jgi:hypothetical protein
MNHNHLSHRRNRILFGGLQKVGLVLSTDLSVGLSMRWKPIPLSVFSLCRHSHSLSVLPYMNR